MAAQLGRLDLVSILLAALGTIIVLAGVFAFLNLRAEARRTARETAREITRELAEQYTVHYLQEELPRIVNAYIDLARNAADVQSDRIASEQDDGAPRDETL